MQGLPARHEGVAEHAPFSAEKLLRPLAVAQSIFLLLGLFVAVQALAHFTITMGIRLEQNNLLPRTAFAAHLGRDIVAAIYRHPQIIALSVLGFLLGPVLFRVNAAQYVFIAFLASVTLTALFLAILVTVTAPTVVPPLLR